MQMAAVVVEPSSQSLRLSVAHDPRWVAITVVASSLATCRADRVMTAPRAFAATARLVAAGAPVQWAELAALVAIAALPLASSGSRDVVAPAPISRRIGDATASHTRPVSQQRASVSQSTTLVVSHASRTSPARQRHRALGVSVSAVRAAWRFGCAHVGARERTATRSSVCGPSLDRRWTAVPPFRALRAASATGACSSSPRDALRGPVRATLQL